MTADKGKNSGTKQPPMQPLNNAKSAPKHDMPSTRLFKVLNPELFIKPNRFIMYGGAIAVASVVLWLGTNELKHRQGQAIVDATNGGTEPTRRPQTYQEKMAEMKRSSE
ncbi:hypothetical protein GGH96_005608 [Coemansia sp. RSA 1972]|nr:hypothetical protein GGH96_005608 [Coemansia sp. RSA 1972]